MRIFFKKHTDNTPRRRRSDSTSSQETSLMQDNTFQRNRTLTRGTTTYQSAGDNDNRSIRVHSHHLASTRRKVGLILLSVLMLAILIFLLLLQFTAKVDISSSDSIISSLVDSKSYVDSIDNYLDGRPISRLRFALDKTDLSNYLSSNKPEVLEVQNISSNAIGETDITLAMRHPLASWTINSKQYFVDAQGVAFEKNYYNNPSLQIIDNSGITPEQGTTVASNRFLSFVGRVVALAKDSGYTVEQAIIPVGTTRQLEIQLKDVGPHVLFSIDRAVGEQVEDMSRALKYLTDRGQSPTRIDVRVSGKAFYQ